MNAFDVFEEAGISSLPTDPGAAARAFDIRVIGYEEISSVYKLDLPAIYNTSRYGFSFLYKNKFIIALNENSCGEKRKRFTLAHELGHCLMGHVGRLKNAENRAPFEKQANRFAADLLAPLPVLLRCGIESAGELEKLCGVSKQAAEIRFAELLRYEKSAAAGFEGDARAAKLFAAFIDRYRDGKRHST